MVTGSQWEPSDLADPEACIAAEYVEGVREPSEPQRLRLRYSVARLGPTGTVSRLALPDRSALHADAALKEDERTERSGVHAEGVRVPTERLRWLRPSVASLGPSGNVSDAVEKHLPPKLEHLTVVEMWDRTEAPGPCTSDRAERVESSGVQDVGGSRDDARKRRCEVSRGFPSD